MSFSLDSTVGELLSDPIAVQVLEKYVPGITNNPMIGFVKCMSIKILLTSPQARQNGLTEENALKFLAEIEREKKTSIN